MDQQPRPDLPDPRPDLLTLIRTLGWILCGGLTIVVALRFFEMTRFTPLPSEQMAIAATSTFQVLALFVIAFAVDRIFRHR